MILNKQLRYFTVLIPILALLMSSVVGVSEAGAKAPPLTKKVSHAIFYNSTALEANDGSPCTSKGCANGIQLNWAPGACFHNERYRPVEVVWTSNGKVSTSAWILTAPCGTGLEFTWDKNDHLNGAKWVGASSSQRTGALAVCFQSKKECNADHCVTAGCIPKATNGVDIFFQGGDSPTSGKWLANGKADGAITISGSPNQFFWYGYTPPPSPFPVGSTGPATATPTVSLTGRTSSAKPSIKTSTAPSRANGVDFTWYLPSYESGPTRGCTQVNGQWWSSPALSYAYTTNGVLSAPVTVPYCPTSGSSPLPYNDVDFSWVTTGSGPLLTEADPYFYQNSNAGCQKTSSSNDTPAGHSPAGFPAGTLAQPPAGANGVVFTFSQDNSKASCWSQNGTVLSPNLAMPEHSRFAVLKP